VVNHLLLDRLSGNICGKRGGEISFQRVENSFWGGSQKLARTEILRGFGGGKRS